MKESIIMTVSDREPDLLLNTLRWLRMSDMSDSEIVIADDRSRVDYEWLRHANSDMPLKWVTLDDYECMKLNENFNNPAKAFNFALEHASGDNIAIVSSDVIVPPRVVQMARKHDTSTSAWCPMVIDLASGHEYCGPHRVFPAPWFLYAKRSDIVACGGWDENYLMGMCYEDNDFIGRLALQVGCFVFDWTCIVWHQSHYQPAYEIDHQWVKAANDRNRQYTLDKWTGIPFGDSDQVAFEIIRGRNENGDFALTFNDIKSVKDKVYQETLSPFVEQKEIA